ncbi:MAG TPA: polyphenol oxidase family protein [Candidatus Limnocylindrales bacterium]|nr:polyphenol oxidase family protein [Candidatus Limnocylindrales bacterium]
MDIYKFKVFSHFKNISHAISTKKFGTIKNDDNLINRENLTKFLKHVKLPDSAICMNQIHSGNVEVVNNFDKLLIENTDGLVTAKKNISLCVVTADCLPILFFDPINQVIGVAHAGRKGLLKGIIKNTIEKFKKEFKSDSKNIFVGIGPGIEKKCYEVNGRLLDLRKIAQQMLLDEGIIQENIEDIDLCTKCNSELLYSYRRGDKYDRFATVISMV